MEQIVPKISNNTADAAIGLSDWFTKGHKMAMNAPDLVKDFKEGRTKMAAMPAPTYANLIALLSIRSSALMDPWATFKRLAKGWNYKRHVQMACLWKAVLYNMWFVLAYELVHVFGNGIKNCGHPIGRCVFPQASLASFTLVRFCFEFVFMFACFACPQVAFILSFACFFFGAVTQTYVQD